MKPTGLMKCPTFGDLRLGGLKRGNNEKRDTKRKMINGDFMISN